MGFESIVDGIYYVGNSFSRNGLDCNPYLLIDGDEGVLFDPGSVIEFEEVLQNLQGIIDLKKIKYVVLHHQDADMCSSVPSYEKLGLNFQIVTSWRAMTLIQYYGIESSYYLLEENDFRLMLKSGRTLEFIPTPYLHFPGAFTTYDKKTKTLLSSDLFGAFSFNRTLFADDTYMEKMLTFHEHYMPSNTVLRPVMDTFLTYDIAMIMPQHGSIIKDSPKKYMHALRELECGTLLAPIKKNLKESGGFLHIFNDIYSRLAMIFPNEEVMAVFQDMDSLTLQKDQITDYLGAPETVWNMIFDTVKSKKGMIWLTVIEPYIRNLCATYNIPMPSALESLIQSANQENSRLIQINQDLEQTILSVNEKLIKCSVTGLYNEVFTRSLLLEELEKEDWRDIGAFATIEIDQFSLYKRTYGVEEERNALKNIAYMLKERFGENTVFRMDASDFALYMKGLTKKSAIEQLEQFRTDIMKSPLFLGRLTVSIGLAFPDEIPLDDASLDLTVQHYMELSLTRLHNAKLNGTNSLCHKGFDAIDDLSQNAVLLVDHDETNLQVMRTFLGSLGIQTLEAKDGAEALDLVDLHLPRLIVSEVNLPKMDGFLLREKLNAHSNTKDIEVVYLSYLKDAHAVKRANELGVMHYLKKPYLMSELLGIVRRYVKGRI